MNPAHGGPYDPGVLHHRFSFAVGPASGSVCRFISRRNDDISRLSRSSALARGSRFAQIPLRPTCWSVRVDPDSGVVGNTNPTVGPETADPCEFVVPSLASDSQNRPKCLTQFGWTTLPDQKWPPRLDGSLHRELFQKRRSLPFGFLLSLHQINDTQNNESGDNDHQKPSGVHSPPPPPPPILPPP